jgi:hypothetical protein
VTNDVLFRLRAHLFSSGQVGVSRDGRELGDHRSPLPAEALCRTPKARDASASRMPTKTDFSSE